MVSILGNSSLSQTASGAAALLTEDEIQSTVREMNSKATYDRNGKEEPGPQH